MEKITLTGVPETMLQTVFARAQETQKQNHKIMDEKTVELVSRLDYDFSLAEKDKTMSSGVIARTLVLDRMVKQYLQKSPGAVVINLAYGLDTRCYQISGLWKSTSLVEGMDVIAPIYKIIGRIPFVRNLSNRIVVLVEEGRVK
ncbi:MAG: class I SAM-dependent methyltransferase [Clostridiales bacterium]|nr:class I SAM-dependent methyltransferase [Clostridiales bacterium]